MGKILEVKTNAPCRECTVRRPGCHSACEAYRKYRALFDAAQEERNRQREADGFVHEGARKGYRKFKQKRR